MACYDATERFTSKTSMATLPAENLKIGDIVLMEVQVSRYYTYKSGEDGSPFSKQGKSAKDRAKAKAKGPTEWQITFELSSISLLAEAPVELEPESEGPDIKVSF